MVALIGLLSGNTAAITLPMVVMRQIALQGVTCGSREDFQDMLAAIDAAKLKPVISDVFPFDRVHDALAAMQSGSHFGKIVVTR
jgi:D-arabinose 1-dehydrogenase-like Zn-dependent alcohol dehydrogenase